MPWFCPLLLPLFVSVCCEFSKNMLRWSKKMLNHFRANHACQIPHGAAELFLLLIYDKCLMEKIRNYPNKLSTMLLIFKVQLNV